MGDVPEKLPINVHWLRLILCCAIGFLGLNFWIKCPLRVSALRDFQDEYEIGIRVEIGIGIARRDIRWGV